MKFKKLATLLGVGLCLVGLAGCSSTKSEVAKNTKYTVTKSDVSNAKKLLINQSKWKYNAKNKVYYQVGIKYGTKIKSTKYETMGIYIPAKYVKATKSGSNTYKIKINTKGKVNGYTAKTAPIVIPINTPGYAAQAAPTGYDSSTAKYTKAGFIYCYAGCRGRQATNVNGSDPWGVTDLKAAIRTLRLNKNRIAGNTNRIITFGHSGGGAQSSLVGTTGNSKLYIKYLKAIGAPMATASGKANSDATYAAQAWCPITSLDMANEAYEWNMGQYSTSGTRAKGTFTKALSNDMAKAYAKYINRLGLKDSDGNTLTLKKSSSGIYTKGSYYNYMKKVVETSLNNFLKDTTFPYKATTSDGVSGAAKQTGTTGSTPSGSAPSGSMPTSTSTSTISGNSSTSASSDSSSTTTAPSGPSSSSSSAPSGSAPSGSAPSGGTAQQTTSSVIKTGKTYKTAKAYINALNSKEKWVKYNSKTNTVKITSMKAFVKYCKQATKDVGAFDGLTRQQTENQLFTTKNQSKGHFDSTMAKLLKENASKYSKLKNYKSSYAKAYAKDLKKKDAWGTSIATRLNMYNPMHFINDTYKGYNTSKVAKYWRIRTGIDQGDTALTVETNLMLALKQNDQVKSVNFATVWGQGHTEAERTGNYETNFIKWVEKITK